MDKDGVDCVLYKLGHAGYSAADACRAVTRIAAGYVLHHGMKWQNFEMSRAILQGAIDELMRIKDDYEDIKRGMNGDVPELAELRALVAKKAREFGSAQE